MTIASNGEYAPNPMPQFEQGQDLRFYLALLRRRFWTIVTVFVIIATLGTIHAYRQVPIYEASANVLVRSRAAQYVALGQSGQQFWEQDGQTQRTQSELVRSQLVLSRAAQDPRIAALFPPPEEDISVPDDYAAATGVRGLWSDIKRTVSSVMGVRPEIPDRPPEPWERLRNRVSVSWVPETDFMLIRAEDADPARAARISNAVADAFVEYHRAERERNVSRAFVFLEEQKSRQEEKLREAEAALQEYRMELSVFSPNEGGTGEAAFVQSLREKLSDFRMERLRLDAEMALWRRYQDEEALGHGVRPVGLFGQEDGDGRAAQASEEALIKARRKVDELRSMYGSQAPPLKEAMAELQTLEALREMRWDARGDMLAARLEALRNLEETLEEKYHENLQEAVAQASSVSQFARLEKEVERSDRLLDILIERMREVDLTSEYPDTRVDVAEMARPPRMPSRPNRFRVILTSCFLGVALGVGLAFLADHLDDAVKTPEELKRYAGSSVLGFVPRISSPSEGSADPFVEHALVAVHEPNSSASEAYREIRTNLFFSAFSHDTKALVVSSALPREGKTTTASNLAAVIAMGNKKVLLIDADLRRPMVHVLAGLDANPGLTNYLSGQMALDECIRSVRLDQEGSLSLDVMTAGPVPSNPAELLDSDLLTDMLKSLREKYDRIVIDSPPVLIGADASILTVRADAVLMVAKAGETNRSALRRAAEQLAKVGGNVLGGVLNDVRVSRLGYYYSDYYHYGYSRYYRNYGRRYQAGERS